MVRPALLLVLLAGCWQPISLFEPLTDGGEDAGSDAGVHSTGVAELSASFFHTCAIRAGALHCWGDNAQGALGVGDLAPRLSPTRVGAAADWEKVSCAHDFTCALDRAGATFCWGANDLGQLGAGDGPSVTAPQRVTLAPMQSVSARFSHACAIGRDGAMWCWGANQEGQLGQDDGQPFLNRATPVPVATGTIWRVVAAGDGHTCGIQADGSLWCWGRNTQRQLGLGAAAGGQVRRPTRVGTDSDWVDVAVGGATSCGLRADGSIVCWGQIYESQPQRNEQVPSLMSTAVRGAAIAAESFGACVITPTQAIACWGRNVEGQLGTGDVTSRGEPTVIGADAWKKVAVGRFHRCAIDSLDRLWCNGEGAQGRLGTGDTARRRLPTPVLFP